MKQIRWCEQCQTNHWSHQSCMPVWLVWDERHDIKDATEFRSPDAINAVIQWAQYVDAQSVPYSITEGYDAVAYVVDKEHSNTSPEKYHVSGETLPCYTARRYR